MKNKRIAAWILSLGMAFLIPITMEGELSGVLTAQAAEEEQIVAVSDGEGVKLPPPTDLKQSGNVSVSWKGAEDSVPFCKIAETKEGLETAKKEITFGSFWNFYDLKPGTSYYVVVGQIADPHDDSSEEEKLLIPDTDISWSEPFEIVTIPKWETNEEKFSQTGAGETSATFTWAACPGATEYEIYYWKYLAYEDTARKTQRIPASAERTYTLTGLEKGTEYFVKVRAYRKSSSGYEATDDAVWCQGHVKPAPVKVSGLQVNSLTGGKSPSISLSASKIAYAEGYECEIYNSKDKLIISKRENNPTFNISSALLKTSDVYKARVRAYVNVDNINEKNPYEISTIYGAWSSDAFATCVIGKATIKKSKTKLKSVTWKPVDGADKYEVFTASKAKGKYKKVKTVRASANKKNYTYNYNKKIKKGKAVFFRILPVKNGGSSFVKTPAYTIKVSSNGKKLVVKN